MKLILIRHCNTFKEGDKIIRIGSKEDLPLTEEGIKQAENIGKSLKEKDIIPSAIYSSNLKRTKTTAEKISQIIGFENEISIDNRLDEINYGSWAGLTDDEIITRFGKEDLDNWNNRGIMPQSAGWSPQESVIFYSIKSFCAEVLTRYKRGITIAITSNGILRYFLKLFPDNFNELINEGKLKLRTGNCALLELKSLNTMELKQWNVSANEISI